MRTEKPPQYRSYGSYKPFLQREFSRTCVYCRHPDTIVPNPNFGVDHYKPKSKFPEDANNYANLYYCCSACNSRKRDHWPTPDATLTQSIPNPCDEVMFDHLRLQGDKVVPRTPSGHFTAELLDLNAPEVVKFRAFVLEMIQSLEAQRLDAQSILTLVLAKRAKGTFTSAQATQDQQAIELRITALDDHIKRLTGSTPIP